MNKQQKLDETITNELEKIEIYINKLIDIKVKYRHRQNDNRVNWGHAGDLMHLNTILSELLGEVE